MCVPLVILMTISLSVNGVLSIDAKLKILMQQKLHAHKLSTLPLDPREIRLFLINFFAFKKKNDVSLQ